MATKAKLRVTPEEYIARERQAEYRSEYHAGEIVAMAGGTRRHSLITRNLGRILDECLDDQDCEVHTTDLRVQAGAYHLYPDVAVVCGEPRFSDAQEDMLMNPSVLMEVLSPSTQGYDRGGKFTRYKQIDSLREYLLVSQDEPSIEHYVRQSDGSWSQDRVDGLEAILTIGSLGCTLPLKRVYGKIAVTV